MIKKLTQPSTQTYTEMTVLVTYNKLSKRLKSEEDRKMDMLQGDENIFIWYFTDNQVLLRVKRIIIINCIKTKEQCYKYNNTILLVEKLSFSKFHR